MERATKTAIKKLVLDLRHLLEEDIEVVLKRYGIFTNREWLPPERIPKADAELLAARTQMEAAVSVEMARGIKQGEATRWYIREIAFTYLNRLVGLKCLEVRGLIDEVITTRVEYGGRSQFHRDFRHDYPKLAAKPDDALPDMLEAACRFVTDEMIGVLFDPDSESSVIWPRYQTLRRAIELINGLSTEAWAEDEIIGWIYQFYNAEEKEKIRKRGKPKLPIEVAVINQFFTPRWVVKYLVDNTLGRLWLEMYPDSARVRARCDYLVPEPLPIDDEAANAKTDENSFTPDPNSPINNPQAPARRQAKPVTQIRLIDPACGAMHFGYYAFEVFQEMYQEARERGWPIWNVDYSRSQPIPPPPTDAEIPALILAHNLYGVDIDLRAVQLAALALYMKSRVAERAADPQHRSQYRVNLVCADARLTNGDLRERFLNQYKDDSKLQRVWRELFTEMEDIAQVGSLLRPEERLRQLIETYRPPTIELETTEQLPLPDVPQKPRQMVLAEAPGGEKWTPRRTLGHMVGDLNQFAGKALSEADVNAQLFAFEAEKTINLLSVLAQEYDALVMNPPFGGTTSTAKKHLSRTYPITKNNLLCAFVELGVINLVPKGFVGAVLDRTFLLKMTYEKFRREIVLKQSQIKTFADLGWGVLDDAQVEVCAIVLDSSQRESMSVFYRIQEELTAREIKELPSGVAFAVSQSEFTSFPNAGFSYWIPSSVRRMFRKFTSIDPETALVREGIHPNDAPRFLRQSWEIEPNSIGKNNDWVPVANGGSFSPYYRDNDSVLWYRNNGWDIKNFRHHSGKTISGMRNEELQFNEGITWGKRTDYLNVQYLPPGHAFTHEGLGIFPKDLEDTWLIIAFFNTHLMRYTINTLCGQHKLSGYVGQLPFVRPNTKLQREVKDYAKRAFELISAWDTGNEISKYFTTPWILQIHGYKEKTFSLSKLLTVLLENETNADQELKQIQDSLNSITYEVFEISKRDIELIEQELSDSPRGIVWPQMEGRSRKEKRREHVRRLISYFVLQAIKADEDGVLSFSPGTGHDTVLEQLRHQVELELDAKAAFQLEDDAGKELGRSVGSWLDGPFIQWHTSLYKKRPILWHLASPGNNFAVLLYYHKLDKDTLPKIRNVYLRAVRDGLRRQLDAVREAKDNKTIGQLETVLDDLSQMEEKLQAVIEAGYNPVIDDGVKANILPLQEAGLLRYSKMV